MTQDPQIQHNRRFVLENRTAASAANQSLQDQITQNAVDIDANSALIASLDADLSLVETDVSAIQAEQTTQNTDIAAASTTAFNAVSVNTIQNNRLDLLESEMDTAQADITALENDSIPQGSSFPSSPSLNDLFILTGNGVRNGLYYADTGTKNRWLSADIGYFDFFTNPKSGTNVPLNMVYAPCLVAAFGHNPPYPCEIVALELNSQTVSTGTVTAVVGITGVAAISLSAARSNKVEVTASADINDILTAYLATGSIGSGVFRVYYRRSGTIT